MRQIFKKKKKKRVSKDAAEELGAFLDDWAEDISQEAVEIAEEDGRSTVRAEDVRQVLRNRKDRDVKYSLSL